MKNIYQGTSFEDIVISPTPIDGARLYNLSTRFKVDMQIVNKGMCDANGTPNASGEYNLYNIFVKPNDTLDGQGNVTFAGTANTPQGVYNLELFSKDVQDRPVIEGVYYGYARVFETSFAQDYN